MKNVELGKCDDLKILVINTNLSTFIVSKNSPSIINTRFNITFIL